MPKKDAVDTQLAEGVYGLLRKSKKSWGIVDLSDHFDVSVRRIRVALEALKAGGKNINLGKDVELMREIAPSEPTVIDINRFKGSKVVFGLTGDNHLCSKYARMDVLNALFDIWVEQGVKIVYQCGNMIDGEARFNRFDLLVPAGIEHQVDYFVEHWPKREGIETHFITGDDHEGWYVQREGVNIGQMIQDRAIQAGRKDLKFLGHMEHDIVLQGTKGSSFMRLIHAGGGSAYATSYTVQKIVESYQGGEKPAILLVGHYHKAEYGYPREVHCVQTACTEDQTPFLRKKKIQAHIGGWTISFELDKAGIVHAFTPQFHPFYDRGFYTGDRWKYHWK